MKKLALPLLAIALTACGQSTHPEADGAKPSTAEAPAPPPQLIVGAERKKIVENLTKGMDEERDKMEGISFYSTKNMPALDSSVDAYISLPDARLPLLRMKATYFGDNWVFYDKIKIMADDAVVYERDFEHGQVHHDNSGGSVWETADYVAKAVDIAALKLVANSKTATIRFAGSEHRADHDVTEKERKSIRSVVDTYERLMSQLQR